MSVKSQLKRIIGPKGIDSIRKVKVQIKYVECKRARWSGAAKLRSNEWSMSAVYSQPDKHVFLGIMMCSSLMSQRIKCL